MNLSWVVDPARTVDTSRVLTVCVFCLCVCVSLLSLYCFVVHNYLRSPCFLLSFLSLPSLLSLLSPHFLLSLLGSMTTLCFLFLHSPPSVLCNVFRSSSPLFHSLYFAW